MRRKTQTWRPAERRELLSAHYARRGRRRARALCGCSATSRTFSTKTTWRRRRVCRRSGRRPAKLSSSDRRFERWSAFRGNGKQVFLRQKNRGSSGKRLLCRRLSSGACAGCTSARDRTDGKVHIALAQEATWFSKPGRRPPRWRYRKPRNLHLRKQMQSRVQREASSHPPLKTSFRRRCTEIAPVWSSSKRAHHLNRAAARLSYEHAPAPRAPAIPWFLLPGQRWPGFFVRWSMSSAQIGERSSHRRWPPSAPRSASSSRMVTAPGVKLKKSPRL